MRILTIVAIITVLPPVVKADGLIQQLPEDGAWVRYSYTMEMLNGKMVNQRA